MIPLHRLHTPKHCFGARWVETTGDNTSHISFSVSACGGDHTIQAHPIFYLRRPPRGVVFIRVFGKHRSLEASLCGIHAESPEGKERRGAEAGRQGEVSSAVTMAAAGLCAVLAAAAQGENAVEIALEHHLGMTCDPVAGLALAPCIERNGISAIKAVAAALLPLRGDGSHFMPLDNCVEAMRQTGREMSARFKETSLGGLAVNLPTGMLKAFRRSPVSHQKRVAQLLGFRFSGS